MQTGGGGFAAAVTDQDQLVDYKVTVTLPNSVQSSFADLTKSTVSVDINRAVVTSLPDGTTLISGYPSAAATVVLAGMLNQSAGVALVEAQSAYWLFNPNDSTSPMWRTTRAGLPITIQAGFWDGAPAADLVTQYTGTIDQVTCSNGVVTLACRDQRSTITNQAVLPPVVTDAPFNAGLTSEYAIDYLARHASPAQYLSWPAQRANCVLSVGFRSSLWPDVGSYAFYTQTPVFAQGVFGSAYCEALGAVYTTSSPIATTQTAYFEFWATCGVTVNINDTAVVDQFSIQWQSGGTLEWWTTTPSGQSAGVAISGGTTGSHYISGKVTWASGSTSCAYVVNVDSGVHSGTITALDARTSSPFTTVAAFGSPGTVEALQVTTETSPVSNFGFSPTLVLDPGGSLNPLVALPDVSGQDAWSVLQDIANAEAGVIGFDELGVLRFVNRQTIRTMTSQRTITSTTSMLNLDSLEQMSLCATHIQIPVNQISIQAAATIWSSTSTVIVNGYSSTTFIATTSSPVVNVAATDSGFMPTSPTAGLTYWRASTLPDGSAFGVVSGISVSVEQLSGSALSVTVTNTNPFAVYLVNPTGWPDLAEGSPTLFIGGQAVASTTTANGTTTTGTLYADVQWPPLVNGGAVTNKTFGEVLLQVQQSNWLQDLPTAQILANDLLRDLHYPKPLYRNLTIVADPRLQLLDRVTLVDSDMSQINGDALIIGLETQLSAGQWTQTIDARAWNRPGAWLLGVAGSTELGVNTYIY